MNEEGADIGQPRVASRLEADAVQASTALLGAGEYDLWTTGEEYQRKQER
jgi:hypothetical protein